MVCLDTDVLVGFLGGDGKAAEVVRRLEEESMTPAITTITAYELLKGALISSNQAGNPETVRRLIESLNVLPLTNESCRLGAAVYAELRVNGKVSGEFNVLIAGIVLENGER